MILDSNVYVVGEAVVAYVSAVVGSVIIRFAPGFATTLPVTSKTSINRICPALKSFSSHAAKSGDDLANDRSNGSLTTVPS